MTSSQIAQSIGCRVFSVPIFVLDPHTTAFQHIEEPELQVRISYHEGASVAQVLIDAAQVAWPANARSAVSDIRSGRVLDPMERISESPGRVSSKSLISKMMLPLRAPFELYHNENGRE